MSDKPFLEQNEDGEMLPAALPDGVALTSIAHKPGEIEKIAAALTKFPPTGHRFPDVCAHPDCEKTPIVGVDRRFVCEDHAEWVKIPVRDLMRLVRDTFKDD